MANIETTIQINELELKACLGDKQLEDIPWDKLADLSFEAAQKKSEAQKEISLCICSEADIQKLNAQYRNKDYVTDVLSFTPASIEGLDLPILGDIVICLKKAEAQAQEHKHSINYELAYLFVHGLLHLLGHDHEEPDEAQVMFDLQDQVLGHFEL